MECEHDFKLENTQVQYPVGMDPVEYAYLMCKKCFKVIKTEVDLEGL